MPFILGDHLGTDPLWYGHAGLLQSGGHTDRIFGLKANLNIGGHSVVTHKLDTGAKHDLAITAF